jgi:hypothetical protein
MIYQFRRIYFYSAFKVQRFMSDHDYRSHRAGPTDAVSGTALVGIWGLRGVWKLPVAKNSRL